MVPKTILEGGSNGMNKKNLAVIILIVSVTLALSFLLIKAIFGTPNTEQVKVERVELITADVVQPSAEIFNKNAINPTIVISIGKSGGKQPFGQ